MSITLNISSALFLGLSQAQRSVGQASVSYSDVIGDDVYQYLNAGASFIVPDAVTAFVALSDVPLTVVMDGQPPITMSELMVSDSDCNMLVFTNPGKTTATLHLTYVGYPPIGTSGTSGTSGTGAAPVADFVADVTSGISPLMVNFTDQSTNSPTSWYWEFGDGNTGSGATPSNEYTSPGMYTVLLSALNSFGQGVKTRTNYITVTEAPALFRFWSSANFAPAAPHYAFFQGCAAAPGQEVVAVGGGAGSNGSIDFASVVRWDTYGNQLWESRIGTGPIYGEYVNVDVYGSIYACVADFNEYVVSIGNGDAHPIGTRLGLYKLDANGTLLWQKKLTAGTDFVHAVQSVTLPNGTVTMYVRTTYNSTGAGTIGLIKLDLDGNVVWHNTVSPSHGLSQQWDSQSGGLTVDSNGDLYVLCPKQDTPVAYSTIMKFDSSGNPLWIKDKVIEAGFNYYTSCIKVASDTVYYAVGNEITIMDIDGHVLSVLQLNGMHNGTPISIDVQGSNLVFIGYLGAIWPADPRLVVGTIDLTTPMLTNVNTVGQSGQPLQIDYNYCYSQTISLDGDKFSIATYAQTTHIGAVFAIPLDLSGYSSTGVHTLANGCELTPVSSVSLARISSPAASTNSGISVFTTTTLVVDTTWSASLAPTIDATAGPLVAI